MKRFRFALEPVLTLREQKEQQAQQGYARAVRACEEIASRLQALRLEMEACWMFLREELIAGTSALALAHTRAFVCALEEREKKLLAELQAAREKVQQAWQALLAATRDHDALENFRNKLFRSHQRDVGRAEQKFLDELAGRMAASALSRQSPATQQTEFA